MSVTSLGGRYSYQAPTAFFLAGAVHALGAEKSSNSFAVDTVDTVGRLWMVMMSATAASEKSADAYAPYRNAMVAEITERLEAAEAAGLGPAELGDPGVLARRAGSVIPVPHAYDVLAGPFYDTAGVTGWLNMSRQAVHKAVRAGRLLGCRTEDGHVVYTMWQFTDDGHPVPDLSGVLSALDAPADPWRAALWLTAPASYLPGEVSAADWLASGGDPQPVVTVAKDAASRWAA